jgi:hypothetical protein
VKWSVLKLIDEVYVHFDQIQLYRNIYKHIFQNVANANFRVQEKSLKEISQLKVKNIASNSGWNEVVMFGAFLVEIYKVQALPITTVENWIVSLLPGVEKGNINAEIALLLVLKRISSDSKFTDTRLWKRFMAIVRRLAGVNERHESETSSQSQGIAESWTSSAAAENSAQNQLQIDAQHDETLAQVATNSAICKSFQASFDGPVKFDNNKFEFITSDEIEVCARIMIDRVISHPGDIKHVSTLSYHYQEMLMSLRTFTRYVVQDCMKELFQFEKENFAGMNAWHYINYATFFAELYIVTAPIFETNDMINWIELLVRAGNELSTDALVLTMKICGRKLKIDDAVNFDQYFKMMKDSATSRRHKKDIEELESEIKMPTPSIIFIQIPFLF